MSANDRMARRLDQVDRRSQVSVSRAMRARDVSRPDPAAVAAALESLEDDGDPSRGSSHERRERPVRGQSAGRGSSGGSAALSS